MSSVLSIITSAHRKIGVAADDEQLTADQIAVGVEAFNDMLHGWKLRGVDVTHTDQAAPDTFALADEYREGTVYLLAARLSPNYEMPANFDADDFFRAIQAAYAEIDEATVPTSLTRPPSQYPLGKYRFTI